MIEWRIFRNANCIDGYISNIIVYELTKVLGGWGIFVKPSDTLGPILDTLEEAKQWCEIHHAVGAT